MAAGHLGPKGVYRTPLTYNALSSSTTIGVAARDDEDEVGMVRLEIDPTSGLLAYRFILLDSTAVGAASVASGDAVGSFNTTFTTGTTVVASYISGQNSCIGIGQNTLTAGNKGWVQTGGLHSTVNTTGSTFAVGDVAILSGTTKRIADVNVGTAPTHVVVGVAVAATSGNATAIRLSMPLAY